MVVRFRRIGLVLSLVGVLAVPAVAQSVDARSGVSAGTTGIESFDIKVFLEGAYTGGSPAMSSALRGEAYFPLTQPFSGSEFDGTPMKYNGTETIGGAVPAGVVDWVLVEIRTDGISRADSATSVAALLMNDGSIRATDGTSLPSVSVLLAGIHYAVVRHRNHMPVLTQDPVDMDSASPVQTDLTASAAAAYGAGATTDLGGGVYGLLAGDPNGQNGITASDKSVWVAQNGGVAGYHSGDFNLSGSVTASDKSFWVQNNGSGSPVPGN